MTYREHADLQTLGDLRKLAPAEFAGFVELDKIVGREDGAIPVKYRELMALAVALTTQCPYRLDVRTANAKRVGAKREEAAEVASIAAADMAVGQKDEQRVVGQRSDHRRPLSPRRFTFDVYAGAEVEDRSC